jgi:hypothetical protein
MLGAPIAILQSRTILARLDAAGQIVGLAYMPGVVEKAYEAHSHKTRVNLNCLLRGACNYLAPTRRGIGI